MKEIQGPGKRMANRFIGIGAAFYPENHDPATCRAHIRLMAKAGLSCVRMGEFAWNLMEPEEGDYDFAWLDDALDGLREHGITAILCTPTAVPPVWACERYPDIFPVSATGRVIGFGSRRYTCPTSESYRRLCVRIAEAMGRHYGASDQVIGWQIDNEFGHPLCYCSGCREHFQAWCRDRFDNIEAFNAAIGAQFWGQTLRRFDQIPLPDTYPNPALSSVFHQWLSEIMIECYGLQVDALRQGGVQVPVTTNMMITWYGYDHAKMADKLDVIAGDHYSLGNPFGEGFAAESFTAAYLRGLKPGTNIRYHELQCARTAHQSPVPGQVRWWTLTQAALGADLLCYFRWDTAPAGAERNSHGLVNPGVRPRRHFNEVQRVTRELLRLKPLLDGTSPPPAEIGILFSFSNHCELTGSPPHPALSGPQGNGYSIHLSHHFKTIREQRVPVDIVYPGSDLSAYRCIVAPMLPITSRALAAELEAYVRQGGLLLLTACSGWFDENGLMWPLPCPGPLADLAGIQVVDYAPYHPRMGETGLMLAFPSSGTITAGTPVIQGVQWIDELVLAQETTLLATFKGGIFDGSPAVTSHGFGQGTVFYLGTLLDEKGYRGFYNQFLRLIDIPADPCLPDGVYRSIRQNHARRLVFLSNENAHPVRVSMPSHWRRATGGNRVEDAVTLEAFDVQCFLENMNVANRDALYNVIEG